MKKPHVVYFLALVLFLSPVYSLTVSLFTKGLIHKTPSFQLGLLLAGLDSVDQFLLFVLSVTGLLLLRTTKSTWFFALLMISAVATKGLIDWAYNPLTYQVKPISLLAYASLFILLYYFRYPYLDRRERIFQTVAKRYKVNVPSQCYLEEKGPFDCRLLNVSSTGSLLDIPSKPELNKGTEFRVSLNEKETISVKLVWNDGPFYGVQILNQKGPEFLRETLKYTRKQSSPVAA